MEAFFNDYISFMIRVLPGLVLGMLLLVIIPGKARFPRIIIHGMIFLLIRDAMTPENLWFFGTEGFFWLRFTDSVPMLLVFSAASLIFVRVIWFAERDSRDLLIWFKGQKVVGLLAGAATSVIVALPLLVYYGTVPIEMRGGAVAGHLLPLILSVSLTANLWEEFLFRGYIQGYLEQEANLAPVMAALGSGLFFAFGHSYLASTVTDIGYPLLLFALWEGCLAGLIRMKWGIIPAAMTHGLAVFWLASGIR